MQAIRVDAWMAELLKISQKSDDGLSRREWAEALNVSLDTAAIRLRKAKEAGVLVQGFRDDRSIDGKTFRCPVYSIKMEDAGRT